MNLLAFKRLTAGLGLLAVLQPAFADIHPACRQGDKDIVPMHRQAPHYPHSAWLSCIEGHVVVEFTVDENGRVADPTINESEPPALFDRAAMSAIKQWTFLPRCIDGQPVARTAIQRMDFTHEGIGDKACGVELDEQATALLTEITIWYAMLHNHQMAHATLHGADHLRPAAEPAFSGDLARVAEFHRQFINSLIEQSPRTWVPAQPINLFTNPAEFDNSPSAEQVLERLAAHRDQYAAEARLRAEHYRDQQQKFRDLRAGTRLPPGQLELLIHGLLGDLDQDLDGLYPADAEVLSLLSDIVQFLELHRGEWAVNGWAGIPTFDDEFLMAAFVEHFTALTDHVQAQQDEQQRWAGSYLDYLH